MWSAIFCISWSRTPCYQYSNRIRRPSVLRRLRKLRALANLPCNIGFEASDLSGSFSNKLRYSIFLELRLSKTNHVLPVRPQSCNFKIQFTRRRFPMSTPKSSSIFPWLREGLPTAGTIQTETAGTNGDGNPAGSLHLLTSRLRQKPSRAGPQHLVYSLWSCHSFPRPLEGPHFHRWAGQVLRQVGSENQCFLLTSKAPFPPIHWKNENHAQSVLQKFTVHLAIFECEQYINNIHQINI